MSDVTVFGEYGREVGGSRKKSALLSEVDLLATGSSSRDIRTPAAISPVAVSSTVVSCDKWSDLSDSPIDLIGRGIVLASASSLAPSESSASILELLDRAGKPVSLSPNILV